jgi:hypothetical protein
VKVRLLVLALVAGSALVGSAEHASARFAPAPLSASDRQSARHILAASSQAQKVLAGQEYTIIEEAPWYYSAASGSQPGAAVRIVLPKRPTIAGQWLALSYPATSSGYLSRQYGRIVFSVEEIVARIDLRSGRVVGLDPVGASSRSYPADRRNEGRPKTRAGSSECSRTFSLLGRAAAVSAR